MTTFYIQQFGCRATQADGAALERELLVRGCTRATDPTTAAIVVLNTCTVTAAADAEARDTIRKIHSQNPAARLIVTGCYAQRAPEELAALPGVHWVVGNSHKPQIPALVDTLSTTQPPEALNDFFPATALIPDTPAPFHSLVGARLAPPVAPHYASILTGDIFDHPEFLSAPIQGGESLHTRPILKIQDGCNNRCSFCVIPFVRGKSRSLPPDAVILQIQKLTAGQTFPSASPSLDPPIPPFNHPAREIVLSGINLGTYGRDISPRTELIELIRRILDETTVERLRVSSIEPLDVTQDLVELFAKTDRIAQHFHMPLQSASDRILASMHRWYRAEHYARRVDLIHDRLPNAAIGADVITGFPGETESDHAATLAFIERHPFTYLHVFSYSPRPGTKAASLANQVPASTSKRRARQLRSLAEQKSSAFRQSQFHRTLRVLTLHRVEHAGSEHTPALSSNYLRVQVPGIFPSNLWLDVAVTCEEGNCLLGEPASTLSRSFASLC
jgi:threonylcarbamoyladenosine tRNA methylthiotransferase MtaB